MATPARITSVAMLHDYLRAAMQLEHATLPVYLTALYSLHPNTNAGARQILRVAAVEEMLHLTLAANVLNAVGGTPDLTAPGFVPRYPTSLPDGEVDFLVSRQRFGRVALDSFLKIERPRQAPAEHARLQERGTEATQPLAAAPDTPHMQYYSIGEFYAEIERGLRHLHEELGDALFCGDPARQAGPEYFYSGGGELAVVTDLPSALRALTLIAEQGEGYGGHIFDSEHELAHYYRFEQLALGRYYLAGDAPGQPSGPELHVDWDASYPLLTDATVADFPEGSELRAAAEAFNASYGDFLALLTRAYSGQPELLLDAVVAMFRLRDAMLQLIRHPVPGRDGVTGAPTFEVSPAGGVAPATVAAADVGGAA